MHSLVAKIMTFGAVAGVAAVLALGNGRTALGAEIAEQSAKPNDGLGTPQTRQERLQGRHVVGEGYGRWIAYGDE
jgi:hypothetical protein